MKYIMSIMISASCLAGCANEPPSFIPTELPANLVEQGWIALPALTDYTQMHINPSKITPAVKEGRASFSVISNLSEPQTFLGKTGHSIITRFLINCSKKKISYPYHIDVYGDYFGKGEYIYTKSTTMRNWRNIDETTDMKVLYHNICRH